MNKPQPACAVPHCTSGFTRAVLDRNMTVETAPMEHALEHINLSGMAVLDFGCGNGNLLRLLRNTNADTIYAFEVMPEHIDQDILDWANDNEAKPRLLINPDYKIIADAPDGDLTAYNYRDILEPHAKFAIVSNPPYFLYNRILSLTQDEKFAGALMITSKGRLRNHAGWTICAVMNAEDFDPPAGNSQYLVQTGLGLCDDDHARPCGTPQFFPPINNREDLADPTDHYPQMWEQLDGLKKGP
ncbi:MAG: hypothetical protein JWO78_2178 [Micavibrio sp.]|nr:hypothetical protein [Micavibrio sp.]